MSLFFILCRTLESSCYAKPWAFWSALRCLDGGGEGRIGSGGVLQLRYFGKENRRLGNRDGLLRPAMFVTCVVRIALVIANETLFLLYCSVFSGLCNPFVYPSRYFPDIMRLFKAENALILRQIWNTQDPKSALRRETLEMSIFAIRWQIIWTVRTIGSYHIFKWERPERESSTVCEKEGEEVCQKVTLWDTAQSLLSFRHCLSLKYQIELGAHYNGFFLGTLNGKFFYLNKHSIFKQPT